MKRIYLVIWLASIFMGCVTEVDFENNDGQFIAISGVLSNNPQERRITFFENINSNATLSGSLYKNGEFAAELIAIQRRTLILPEDVVFEVGSTYHIEINTSSGETYLSKPQEVLKPRKPEGLKTTILNRVYQEENGNFVEAPGINVLAEMPVSDQTTPYFLRFQMSESWQYQEVADTRVDPRVTDTVVNICYIIRDLREFPSQVWSSAGQLIGTQDVFVANKRVDQSFLNKHYFNVITHSISPDAYTYYENVKKISENTGTLLDEIPAAIPGNIYNVNNDKEIVYGYLEISEPDTTRIFVDGLNLPISSTCTGPSPCVEPFSSFQPLPGCPCADCLLIEGATYEKPDYF